MFAGGCQCGFIRYEISGTDGNLSVCHCTECQKQSGSAFGMSLNVAPERFELRSGRLKSFEVVCDSGRTKTCTFCPDCGSRIYHASEIGMSVKAGTLDDTSSLTPAAHYWTASKQHWVEIPEGIPSYVDDD